MLKCGDCGYLFEEDEIKNYSEKVGEVGLQDAYMNFSGCPNCGGGYEEIQACKLCGEYEENLDDGYCKSCINDIFKRLNSIIDDEFSEEEKDFLREGGIIE